MKATGIVRRVDELGRIVIPKELRRNMHLVQGNPLEIFIGGEGEIILKKYSPAGEIQGLAQGYANALAQTFRCLVLICDRDQYIAAAGKGRKEYLEKLVGKNVEKLMLERSFVGFAGEKGEKLSLLPLYEGDENVWEHILALPMVQEGDVIGGIIFCRPQGENKFGEVEEKAILCAGNFLGNPREN